MNFLDKKKRLDYLLELIIKGQCLSILQIALKFDCSGKTVKRMIGLLREEGNDIIYCKSSKKFRIRM